MFDLSRDKDFFAVPQYLTMTKRNVYCKTTEVMMPRCTKNVHLYRQRDVIE